MNRNRVLRVSLLLVLLAGIVVAVVFHDRFSAAALEQWVRDAGALAPVVFILLYAMATVLFLPGSILTLAGGALFGPLFGTVYNLAGATLGATLAFLVARYLAADRVAGKAGGRVQQLIRGVENEGWRFVAFVRLVPLFPFNVLNYALGLTRLHWLTYAVASAIFMAPGAFAYTWLGYVGREVAGGGEALIQKGLLALALVAAVAFLPRFVSRLRAGSMLEVDAFRQLRDNEPDLLVLDVRTAGDFAGEQGHIDGATNIPLEELPQRIDEIARYQELPVAIVCRTDKRSAQAARLLVAQGFADTHVVRGGMTQWLAAGLPVAR